MELLRDRDPTYKVFGSGEEWGGHHYRFLPILPEREIIAFERLHEIELPADYRLFLSLVGDGGAGPDYGVVSLKEAARDTAFSVPFPWTEKHQLQSEEEFTMWEQRPGCLELCHHGCGYYELLVVRGPTCGLMWCDYTAAKSEFAPLSKSFYQWYRDWAEEKLRRLSREPLLDEVTVGMSLPQLIQILGEELETWEGVASQPGEHHVAFADVSASFLIGADRTVKRITRLSL